MKVYAQYASKPNGITQDVKKFNSKKEAIEHFKAVGYRQSKYSDNFFYGCMSNGFGSIMDVAVTLYPCNAMPEERLWN